MTFGTVKKISIVFFLTLTLLAVLFLGFSFFSSPHVAEDKTKDSLEIFGLDTGFLPPPEFRWGQMLYKDVPLDKDNISGIKILAVEYNPFSIIFNRRVGTIIFDRLSLIGDWTPETPNPVSFSGWTIPDNFLKFSNAPARRIRLTNAEISVLTPDLGGLTLDFDVEGSVTEKKIQFQSHLKSAQKYISFTAGSDGIIAHDYSNVSIEIDEGKFEVPEARIRATRAHGTVNITKNKSDDAEIMAELWAGGITILNLPWSDASATVEYKDGNLKIYSEAKSVGVEGLEFSLNYQHNAASAPVVSGTLHADDGKTLVDYLAQQTKIFLPKDDIKFLKSATDVHIDFLFEDENGKKKIKYRINNIDDAPLKEVTVD